MYKQATARAKDCPASCRKLRGNYTSARYFHGSCSPARSPRPIVILTYPCISRTVVPTWKYAFSTNTRLHQACIVSARARAITERGWKRSLRGTRSGWLLVRTKSFAPERELAAGQQTAGSNRPATVIYVREAARMHLWTHTSVRARERMSEWTRAHAQGRVRVHKSGIPHARSNSDF